MIGRTITLDDKVYTVIGVMPADFRIRTTELAESRAEFNLVPNSLFIFISSGVFLRFVPIFPTLIRLLHPPGLWSVRWLNCKCAFGSRAAEEAPSVRPVRPRQAGAIPARPGHPRRSRTARLAPGVRAGSIAGAGTTAKNDKQLRRRSAGGLKPGQRVDWSRAPPSPTFPRTGRLIG